MIYAATIIMIALHSALIGILISGAMTLPETVACVAVSVLVGYALHAVVMYHRARITRAK